jgi:hypothetical protein
VKESGPRSRLGWHRSNQRLCFHYDSVRR